MRLRKDIPLPQYRHRGDAGVDFVNAGEKILLKPQERALISTGIKVAVPSGYELQIRPRSGLAINKGLTVLNSPGTVDSTYRGEVQVIIFNASPKETIEIRKGERIAQAVLKKVELIEWEECEELDETMRNEGGFGSTG
jgi:dUTP pyrophosphatase